MQAGAELIERARLVCGAEHVLTDPVLLSTYRSDGARRDGPLPLAVALPADRGEVIGVVSACAQAGVPWTVRGAGTSTGGGALPRAGAMLIGLARMRRVLSLELDDDRVTVEPGVSSAAIARAVAPSHSFPRLSAGTVGGAVARGAFAPLLLGVELVTNAGALLRADRRMPGYDLTGVFSGSGGRRGIAVALTLQVEPLR